MNAKHKRRFTDEIQRIGKVYDGKIDQEYGAALLLLTVNANLWDKVADHVGSVYQDRIDFEAILADIDLSGGEEVIVRTAWNLFNGGVHIDPVEFMRLDEANFNAVIQALQLRRAPMRLADLDQ